MGLCHGNQGPLAGSLPATLPQAGGLWELLGQGHTPLGRMMLTQARSTAKRPPPKPQDPDRHTSPLAKGQLARSSTGHHENSLSLNIYISLSRYTFIICIFLQHSSSFLICLF